MIVIKYYLVKYDQKTVAGPMPMYAMGYNKWTNSLAGAKLFSDIKKAKRIANNKAPGGFDCELLHATLSVEDTNDLLEKAFDLS